jgi:N-methylhydantoinase B
MTTIPAPPSLANERQRRQESLRYGYIPPKELVVDPSISFDEEADCQLDVVTYEVIRSKLWNLNVDHGDTIRRVSGSNIVVEGYDFNTAVTTETGDAVTFSPYSMFFAGFADEIIKWTLEHRSMNVGIRDGDVFLQDDPWVGSNHQMDTAVFGPVFLDGKLFAWLFNCVHQREIGGKQPGGFIQDATDVYTEPTFMPPIKLAENGVVREDVVDVWTRRSRLPELMALELNSQVAGFTTARHRLSQLLERYGRAAVKGTMYKMIDDTAKVVGARFARLPDAEWQDERYVSGANPGDLRLFRLCLTFRKTGDRLYVSNLGTDPAVGSINVTPGVFRASVLNGLLPIVAYDQYLCAAGVLRQVDFDCEQGAINSASHPSAVSTSLGSVATINQAQVLASKMVSGDQELSTHAFASSTFHTMSTNGVMWRDPSGHPVGDAILDMCAGGVGAFNHRDGIDFGGGPLAVANHFSDVEKFEQVIPFLYLYRRELPYSGGHGRWRGGVTLSAAWVGHKNDTVAIGATGFVKSVTMGLGVCGGLPASGGYHWYAPDTDIQRWFTDGRLPGDPAELRQLAPHGRPAPLQLDMRLSPDDVFELFPNAGAGWGDTLERQPDLVVGDLRQGRVRLWEAPELYGVVVDGNGILDRAGSDELRRTLRQQRLEQARPPRKPLPGSVTVAADSPQVVEGVAIIPAPHGPVFACVRCGQILADAAETYRYGCAELDGELSSISELHLSPEEETGQHLVVRRYLCPSCGALLDANICRPEDLPFDDAHLAGAVRTTP